MIPFVHRASPPALPESSERVKSACQSCRNDNKKVWTLLPPFASAHFSVYVCFSAITSGRARGVLPGRKHASPLCVRQSRLGFAVKGAENTTSAVKTPDRARIVLLPGQSALIWPGKGGAVASKWSGFLRSAALIIDVQLN